MGQRVFVNVVGFTDEERHALNLMFRMSEEHDTAFSLWEPQAPEAARVSLIDGESYEARVELELPRNANIPNLWVGEEPPYKVWRAFRRPIQWNEVIAAMDELFPFDPTDSSFDIDLEQFDTLPPDSVAPDIDFEATQANEFQETQPPDAVPPEMARPPRALIACAGLEERLYYRAKMSLAGLTIADDAETAPQALELVRDNDYVLAIVDLSLGGLRGWDFLADLGRGKHPVPKIIVVASQPTFAERVRARFAGVTAFMAKPADPNRLHDLLAQD